MRIVAEEIVKEAEGNQPQIYGMLADQDEKQRRGACCTAPRVSILFSFKL
jgi:hypothetical protein